MDYSLNSWFPQDGISFSAWKEWRESVLHPDKLLEPEETEWVTYYVGVDLGMRRDPSTVAVVELRENARFERFHYVKYLKRFSLRTLYSNVAATLAKIDSQLKGEHTTLTYSIDATGVGDAVIELIERKMPLADIYRVYVTGGISATFDGREVRLPKSQLVSTLVAAFDSDRVYLSKKSHSLDAMLDELENYEIHVSDEGSDSFGAFKTGKHDDLVTSLGLAVWLGEQFGARSLLFW
jgi:hypothetical protein